MKNNKFNFLILINILCLTLLLSCDSDRSDKEYIGKELNRIVSGLSQCYDYVVILPGSGCKGCITEGELFFKDNQANENILFVLTKIHSLKTLSHKVGFDIKKSKNVHLDLENKIVPYDNIYPILIKYDCNKLEINGIEYQKPGVNVFDQL
jgi:hypothetical protein